MQNKQDFSIHIASDHAGFELKQVLLEYLTKENYLVNDHGCFSEEAVDYPDYAKKLCFAMSQNQIIKGILICGSGIGMSIIANRYKYIRAALCHNSEMARLARRHNDANILVLGARFIDKEEAIACVHEFLITNFEAGRHKIRVDKL